MNAHEIYEEIKAFLNYAGLSFSQMDLVKFTIVDEKTIQLQYAKIRTLIDIS